MNDTEPPWELPRNSLERVLKFCAGEPFYRIYLGKNAMGSIRNDFQATLQDLLMPATIQDEGQALARLFRAGFILSDAQMLKARKYGGLDDNDNNKQQMLEDKRKEDKPLEDRIVIIESEPEVGDSGSGGSTRAHSESLKPIRVA